VRIIYLRLVKSIIILFIFNFKLEEDKANNKD